MGIKSDKCQQSIYQHKYLKNICVFVYRLYHLLTDRSRHPRYPDIFLISKDTIAFRLKIFSLDPLIYIEWITHLMLLLFKIRT